MKLTVLGCYGPYPAAGGACSGYLLEAGPAALLLDCGSGVLSRLQQIISIGELDAVLLSHLHSDHMADTLILRYALQLLHARGEVDNVPLRLLLPKEPETEYKQLCSQGVFEAFGIEDGMKAGMDGLDIVFHEMTHPVKSFAMEIRHGGKKLVYSGDTNFNPKLAPLCEDADVLLVDAGLLAKDKTGPQAPHLSAREAGEIAAAASVKRLLLTHLYPGYAMSSVLREAQKAYPNAELVKEMTAYEI